ncbi:putative helicase C-terminal domain protein [Mycobacterium kansasii]|uniref:Putative helicase C-terminal domain protein n=1 Tax=Mycobacterium kansasii TaxID=1768 RepID=A0A1V3W9X5_MYCKA|nr:putative helicase C-terminal domain protein [Mycobacterium kansasii]
MIVDEATAWRALLRRQAGKDQTLPTRRAARQNHPPPATDDRTPHSGKEEDFQLFLTLLDRDRFEGKHKKTADTSGIMRRMVKEELLTFEGKKLFPERIAETCPTS